MRYDTETGISGFEQPTSASATKTPRRRLCIFGVFMVSSGNVLMRLSGEYTTGRIFGSHIGGRLRRG